MATKDKNLGISTIVKDPSLYQDQRNEITGRILNTEFKVGKKRYKLGEEVKVSYQEALNALNILYHKGYVKVYHLLPENIPDFTLIQGTTEVNRWLIPLLVQSLSRKMRENVIDICAPNNLALIGITEILAWYWYAEGGPRPDTKDTVRFEKIRTRTFGVYQNAVLSCPLCGIQFTSPDRLVTQESKVKAWLKWLTPHFKESHHFKMTPKRVSKPKV